MLLIYTKGSKKVFCLYIVVLFTALLLLYDVTNKISFDNIRAWLGEIKEYAQDDVVIMLLGKEFKVCIFLYTNTSVYVL